MTRALSRLALAVPLAASGLLGCDDKPKADERKGVIEGAKPESAAGRKLEKAKQEVDEVEKTMEKQDQDRFERSGSEQVPRGVP